MAFQDFEPIFAQPKLEWKPPPHTSSPPLRPFLFHAHAPHSSHLVIHVTDFHSDTWEAHLSVSSLEDIVSILNHPSLHFVKDHNFYLPSPQMDIIGIGGSWSEFADYFVNSLKSEDLKLLLEPNSNSDGKHVYFLLLSDENFKVNKLIKIWCISSCGMYGDADLPMTVASL